MSERIAYLNGEFIPDSQCKVHVSDRGLRVADAVFDVERTFNGKIFRLRDHLERLYRSLKFVRIDPHLTIDEMEQITLEVVARNEPLRDPAGDYSVWQTVTRGMGSTVRDEAPPTVCVRLYPIDFNRYARFYRTGAHVVFPRTRSYTSDSLDPKVKHYSRMNFVMAELEATDIDPEAYPVLLDQAGNITENISGNFMIVTDGTIRVPGDQGSLQGISRKTVTELAHQLGIPITNENLQPYDAYTADEAFLTTTSYCILPVGKIDNRPIGEEVPGTITKQLWAAWSELVGVDMVEQALHAAESKG